MTIQEHETQDLTRFNLTDSAIAEMGEHYLGLTIDGVEDKAGLVAVHDARMEMRARRIEVEKIRKGLKEESLSWGRTVDGEAKRITRLMAPIEEHLTAEESRITTAIKAEKERKAQEVLHARMEMLEAVGSRRSPREVDAMDDDAFIGALSIDKTAFEHRKKAEAAEAERKAEEAKQFEAQKAELAKVQAAQEAEAKRLTEARLKREAAEAEARKLEDARLKAEREELEREKAELAKQKAAVEAQEAKAAKARAALEDASRRIRLAPEAEQVRAIAAKVLQIEVPDLVAEEEVSVVLQDCADALLHIAKTLTA